MTIIFVENPVRDSIVSRRLNKTLTQYCENYYELSSLEPIKDKPCPLIGLSLQLACMH